MKSFFLFPILIAITIIASNKVFAQVTDCTNPDEISSLPFSKTGLTTADQSLLPATSNLCSTTIKRNNYYIFKFTPTENMNVNIKLTETQVTLTPTNALSTAKIGLFITKGCPDAESPLCIGSIESTTANPELTDISLTSGENYYITVTSDSIAAFSLGGMVIRPGSSSTVAFGIEVTKNLTNDLTIESIDPLISTCNNAQRVTVNIRNVGRADASNFNISYTLDSETPVEENYTPTITAGETASYTFTTLLTTSSIGEHTLTVKVTLIGDENTLNDTKTTSFVRYPIYDTYPKLEDFEANTHYWNHGGTNSSWEYGELTDTVITSAHSGTKCMKTKLSGRPNANENSWIESPCYDLSALDYPSLSVFVWADLGFYGNSAKLSYTLDDGATFTDIRTITTSTNGWIEIKENLNFEPSSDLSKVRFRITFTSSMLMMSSGIAVDDFTIKAGTAKDISVVAITSPNSSCGLTNNVRITAKIANVGLAAQSNIPIQFSTDNGTTWSSPETINQTINSSDTISYTFTANADLSTQGDHTIIVKTSLSGDENIDNDSYSKIVLNQPILSSVDYSQSFETSTEHYWYAEGNSSSWAVGTPSSTTINSAGDGNTCWKTNLSGNANSGEISYLVSPCFNFSTATNPTFKAMIAHNTGLFGSGAILEYSTNDGVRWDTVVAGSISTNWYGEGFFGGGNWSGNSQGWKEIYTNMPQIAGQASVKFRFAFKAGATANEGIAVDKIEFADCTPLPVANFTYTIQNSLVTFTNTSTNADTYLWNFGDRNFNGIDLSTTATSRDTAFNYTSENTYTVTLKASNQCGSSTHSETFTIVISDIDNNMIDNISIYPNPASENICIQGVKAINWQVLNMNGQVIINNIDNNSDKIVINLQNLANGKYFIKLTDANNKIKTLSFIKK